jgi:hypothetical protein
MEPAFFASGAPRQKDSEQKINTILNRPVVPLDS